jgi:hypothetical protein
VLVEDLSKVESVSQMLQIGGQEQLSLYECRSLFDGLSTDLGTKYPLSHLKKTSTIVNDPHFENEIVKLQAGQELTLSRQENEAVRMYLTPDRAGDAVDDADIGYAERLMQSAQEEKKRRIQNSKYKCTAHVVCTSN